ncbi:hypothetical protein [Glaciimonas sp. Gout2]|uniref:hypothetical protein n=1 Tax=Glaciimonas sp. Gout2 TaxID=3048625 RepID=UPI003A599AEC
MSKRQFFAAVDSIFLINDDEKELKMKINKLLAAVIVAAFALPVMAQNAPVPPAPAPAATMAAPAAPAAKPAPKHHGKKHHHRRHHAKASATGKINTGH